MNQKLSLTPEEEKNYNKYFESLRAKYPNGLDTRTLESFIIQMGNVADPKKAQFIVSQSQKQSRSEKTNINKSGFLILMKYLSHFQYGSNIMEIDIQNAPSVQLPKLHKKDKTSDSKVKKVEGDQNNIQEKQREKTNVKVKKLELNDQSELGTNDEHLKVNLQEDLQGVKKQGNFEGQSNLVGISIYEQRQVQQYKQPKNGESAKEEERIMESFGPISLRVNETEEVLLAQLEKANNVMDQGSILNSINLGGLAMKCQPTRGNISGGVQIKGHEKRKDGMLCQSYVAYVVESRRTQERVERRYREFEELDRYFLSKKELQGRIIPKLPAKEYTLNRLLNGADGSDPEFLLYRMIDLEDYLNRVNSTDYLSQDNVFSLFMESPSKFVVPAEYAKSIFESMGQAYHSLMGQNIQDQTDYISVILGQKFRNYISYNNQVEENGHLSGFKDADQDEIEKIMKELNECHTHVVALQDIFYRQYIIQTNKVEKLTALTHSNSCSQSDQYEESIVMLEKEIIVFSNQCDQVAKLKKTVWKEFRSIQTNIDAAKQAHDLLMQQIKNSHFLNHLRERKKANTSRHDEQAALQIENINKEIQASTEDIHKIKALLKKELQIFLKNLNQKINESLDTFYLQTQHEFN